MSDYLNTEGKNDLENKIINNIITKVNVSDNKKENNNIQKAKIEDDEDDEIIENSISVNHIYTSPRIENVEKDNIIEEPDLLNHNMEKNNQLENNILNTEFNDNSFFIHCRNCMKIISIEESKYKFFIIRKDYF
jgi:hypothetical protein